MIITNMVYKVYRYEVDGKEYMRADAVAYDYYRLKSQLGSKVAVYYNPDNPQQATLSTGKGYKITMIILFSSGGFLLLVGLLLLVCGFVLF